MKTKLFVQNEQEEDDVEKPGPGETIPPAR